LITGKKVERAYKTADQEQITEFVVTRLKEEFAEVAKPGFLHNSMPPALALIRGTPAKRRRKTYKTIGKTWDF